jgi:arsenical-resistance protein 2
MPFPVHEHCKKMATKDGQQAPWYNAFPEPKAKPGTIEPSEVAALLEAQQQHSDTPRDFLLVDVRRTDFEGGTVTTSINLPAQSLYPTRKQVYDLAKQAGTKKLIFYCGEYIPAWKSASEPNLTTTGSSNGRGPRCAAWMQDFINETGDANIKSLVLNGGIRGWVKEFGGRLTDGYDANVWESSTEAK